MASLPATVARFEDRGALCGGDDGFDVCAAVLAAAPTLLSKSSRAPEHSESSSRGGRVYLEFSGESGHGASVYNWCIDANASSSVSSASAASPYRVCGVHPDFAGVDRFAVVEYSDGGA
jgi:methylase of polypeptide subunit release factors